MITKGAHTPVSLAQNPKMGWAFKVAGKLLDNYMIQIGTVYHDAQGEREVSYDPFGNPNVEPLPPVIKPQVLRWPIGHARAGEPVIIRGYKQAMEFIAAGKSADIEAQAERKQIEFDQQQEMRAREQTQKFTGNDVAGMVAALLAAQQPTEEKRGPGRPRNSETVSTGA